MIFASADFGLSWILEVVALVFIAYVIWKYVWAGGIGLRTMMDTKKASIRAQLAAGDEAKRSAEQLVNERRSALESAKAEATSIVEQSNAAAAEVVAEGERRAEEDYQRLISRADIEIAGAIARVRVEIAEEASRHIVEAVEAVIEAELDGVAHRRLIGEAIAATESEEI